MVILFSFFYVPVRNSFWKNSPGVVRKLAKQQITALRLRSLVRIYALAPIAQHARALSENAAAIKEFDCFYFLYFF